MKALILGATGGCGRHALTQLLARGVDCTAIVRSPSKLPDALTTSSQLTVVTCASITNVSQDTLAEYVRGCDAVVSCLGHTSIWTGSHDMVTNTTTRIVSAIKASNPQVPVKYLVVSSALVTDPKGSDPARSTGMNVALWLFEKILPPHRDNLANAAALQELCDSDSSHVVEFCAVRPDLLLKGSEAEYEAFDKHQGTSLFNPGATNRAAVGAFMADLVTMEHTWTKWRNKFPHLLNAPAPN